jgi:chemosensory pili system protein ChpA (sensor histidine kinase/response regulator)
VAPELVLEWEPEETAEASAEEPAEPFEPLEPLEPLEPVAAAEAADIPSEEFAAALAAAEAELPVLDFEFDLAAGEAKPAEPPSALVARVPDLPSAADLDLGLPPVAEPLPAEAPAEPDFELDFGALAPEPPTPAAEPAAPLQVVEPAAPLPEPIPGDTFLETPLDTVLELPLDAPVPGHALPPGPQVEAIELDLDALDEVFATRTRPAPGDVPPRPPLQALPELGQALEGFDELVPATDPRPPEHSPVQDTAAAPLQPPVGPESVPAPLVDTAPQQLDEAEAEQVKVIGPLRIGIPLFNIFLNEADELSRRLGTELAEWAHEHDRHPAPDSAVALAHSLAGNSATVGYAELSALARALEHALARSRDAGPGTADEAVLFVDAAEEIRRLLHQFAAGFLRPVSPALLERLAEHERQPFVPREPADEPGAGPAPEAPATGPASLLPEVSAVRVTGFTPLTETGALAAAPRDAFDDDEDIDALDAVDADLFPIFEEEAEELLPQLQSRLRDWLQRPGDRGAAFACMRTLHTFKGGARLAGAMRLGEMAHRLETAVEHLAARDEVHADDVDALLHRADAMAAAFETLRHGGPAAAEPAAPAGADEAAVPALADEPAGPAEPAEPPEPVAALEPAAPLSAAEAEPAPPAVPEELPLAAAAAAPAAPVVPPVAIDWTRFAVAPEAAPAAEPGERPAAGAAAVRVRAALLDRMVNQAGEVSITRARIDADVRQLQGALGDLTDSLERMRRQLRDIELQAETQIASRMEAAKAEGQGFDPLEMDRFTRFQELTRFMAESVNDVATLQRGLQRTLQSVEDSLAAQARLTRELQDDLLRTRMVEFESLADRLYRTVRQAAKDTGKAVRLDIEGGAIEMDRGVLERMAGPFEHLLRNSVAHGVEAPAQRAAAGKDATGRIAITVAQSGNEVAVEFADDGGGLDLQRIRQRGVERGLIAADHAASDEELAQLIFMPGFSTAESVTELAGRGVGLDVVKAEVNAMGGRIETASAPGQGTRFRLLLPLTTAVTQVVMLRGGETTVAVPSTLIEVVRRVPSAEVAAAYDSGVLAFNGEALPFFWLPALLQAGTRGELAGRTQSIVIVRSASQRVALHVDEVVGNQEVVVKNVGPQLARLPGLAGLTLLPSGAVALIYNPVALAAVYAGAARDAMRAGAQPAAVVQAPEAAAAAPARAPLVLVVDDSLTVRRVTQRLLVREGYRVALAKDGLEALEKLAHERPVVLLSDIEMPRMDGFDLLRNVRADARLAGLPVVMITSRIAQKHRDYAAELGADHYLGKPYSEEELLSLVARYAGADIPT